MTETVNITDLIDDITTRSGRAILAQLNLRSPALRDYLARLYAQEPGKPGALLADPVVEATFGWRAADADMHALAGEGLLSQSLVDAMARPPSEYRKEYAFPLEREPFRHQLDCWRLLLDDLPRSVLVTSGTGSGKTECFLVPILEDLARESAGAGPLTGVRALFLYPLNALINSQRDRLRAWCDGLPGDVRFCLYNGETPEEAPAHDQARVGAEQASRKSLRGEPAPLLVTNSTMLEYMLIRMEDQPILAQSQGKLRWIVLDEAHTYIGSQAAEMALLLRRVLHRFAVDPADVRFVATSATIGGTAASDDLQRFLADVSGAPAERVHVVTGERFVPPLPAVDEARSPRNLDGIEGHELYDALCHHPIARSIRNLVAAKPAALGTVRRHSALAAHEVNALLERASAARHNNQAFLPLRLHLFHRSQRGLWACVNATCPRRAMKASDGWDFGAAFPSRRDQCEHCDSPVFELVACAECGQHYLSAHESFAGETGTHRLDPLLDAEDIDEFQLELEPDDLDDQADRMPAGRPVRRLICGPSDCDGAAEQWRLDRERVLTRDRGDTTIHLAPLASGPTVCPRCGARHGRFRELRVGAPFALSTIVPTALEHTPRDRRGASRPSQGRRLLGFSDSRQGSARLAVRLQQESERNRVRSILYHALAAERKSPDVSGIEAEISELEKLGAADNPVLRPMLEQKKTGLAAARVQGNLGRLSWQDAARALRGDASLDPMRACFRYAAYLSRTPEEFANFCLYREFFRRPKRMNSAETMGLVSLRYPSLEQSGPAPGWPLLSEDWATFLKLIVDFFIRDMSAVDIDDAYLRWMGIPVRKRYLQGPGFDGVLADKQRHWPRVRPGVNPSRLIRLLRQASELDDSPSSNDRVNEAFEHAWRAIRPHLRHVGDGYLLKLQEIAVLSEVSTAAVCPVTGRALDATLRGWSPHLPTRGRPEPCTAFTMPTLPKAYWRDASGRVAGREEVGEWLETDARVGNARRLGVWSNLHDRVATVAPYFEAAEHSAQIDGERLRALERRFKEGDLNVLSCSTTMEMGVDIGGLSAVVMNNTPPSPTNYLQRAGRAGRRGEGVSFAVTLCPAAPHGEQVFGNPLWPFTSTVAVPRVALDSARLVQRHVNSLCLALYLEGRDTLRLKTGAFFLGDGAATPPGSGFVEWCRDGASDNDALTRGLARLVAGTALAGKRSSLLEAAANAMERAMTGWRREVDALRRDAGQFADPSGRSRPPAVAAIERQLRRLEGEYLPAELARRQFLPGYGFPTGIASFIPTTIHELRRRESEREGRDESFGKRAGYPSRQLEMAIREYAPGAEVTLDGRVYESAGVTLNWHFPPGATDLNEVQAIRHVWRCRQCGATGDAPSGPDACPYCEGRLETQKYLEPAGFAVDIRHTPHNNVAAPTFVPVEPPWISCPNPDWQLLPEHVEGRFRYDDSGHLFHGSRGAGRHGYAICLRCGRAASEEGTPSETATPEAVAAGHPRLRGGKNRSGDSSCDGAGFAIQRGLTLGGSRQTDVFELQLEGLIEDGTALSIGIALRQAFCRRLGIEEEEVGVAARQARAADGSRQRSIFLFDAATGGNGYVAALRTLVVAALRDSIRVLDCPKRCDTACHGCLLTYGTQYEATKLDRKTARTFLDGALNSPGP